LTRMMRYELMTSRLIDLVYIYSRRRPSRPSLLLYFTLLSQFIGFIDLLVVCLTFPVSLFSLLSLLSLARHGYPPYQTMECSEGTARGSVEGLYPRCRTVNHYRVRIVVVLFGTYVVLKQGRRKRALIYVSDIVTYPIARRYQVHRSLADPGL
jgi:hypothetical protein